MTDPTNADRQARFAARVRERGLVKICEWIPTEHRDTFKRFAAELRGDPPAPPQEPGPDETPDFIRRTRQAHEWGWIPDAIAAYAGITIEQVQRILGESE